MAEPESQSESIVTEDEYFDDVNVKEEEVDRDEQYGPQQEEDEVGSRRKRKRRCGGPPKSRAASSRSFRSAYRMKLGRLLERLRRERRWAEAAGVLSVLLEADPVGPTADEDPCWSYLIAMELHKRLRCGEERYHMWIKNIYEMWMRRLSCLRDNSIKKSEVEMDLALYHFTRGNVDEAYTYMESVVQDCSFANKPSVNLLHGLILFHLWYSGLPEEFKIKDFDIGTPLKTHGIAQSCCYQETEITQFSSNHYAVNSEDSNFSSRYASESSICNGKVLMNGRFDPRKFSVPTTPQEFYVSHSADLNEQKCGFSDREINHMNMSIFFAHGINQEQQWTCLTKCKIKNDNLTCLSKCIPFGARCAVVVGLETNLLPIRLQHLTGDLDQSINRYRSLANGHFEDAVKHLRLALHSTPPVYAALLPLIQLLLLGDQVEEAFKELEKSCHNIDSALPFRLKARLLECFQSDKVIIICSCYENSLKRDPSCNCSLERLIKMHKNGNCSTMLIFEMIALHLDAADGKCSIWEEFASCFLKLIVGTRSEQDSTSNVENLHTELSKTFSSGKIPKVFTEGNTCGSWKLRFEWWKRRHFSKSSVLEQAGDKKLLCFKAACSSHLYGPISGYTFTVLRNMREKEDEDLISILHTHMKNPMNLCKFL